MRLPNKPARGALAMQSMYDSICEIIDFLPSLTIVGDNSTIKVNESRFGRTIQAIQKNIIQNNVSNSAQKQTVFLAKVIDPEDKRVQLYPNGYDKPAGDIVRLSVFNVAFNNNLLAGEKVLVHLMDVNFLAGNDLNEE